MMHTVAGSPIAGYSEGFIGFKLAVSLRSLAPESRPDDGPSDASGAAKQLSPSPRQPVCGGSAVSRSAIPRGLSVPRVPPALVPVARLFSLPQGRRSGAGEVPLLSSA